MLLHEHFHQWQHAAPDYFEFDPAWRSRYLIERITMSKPVWEAATVRTQ